ncbi:RHS repeat-associated core domain-containing protein [Shewanella chilikensis]|uniref:RHS repeat-associated core domain-containing protein n=1 Tax=Shewanella chilikensis TaxID=558541 RepID=UPI003999FB4E
MSCIFGAGNIISRSHYEPFGKRLGGDKAGIGYTGHLQDEDLNLTYMQARYYDPLIGRFYNNDTVGTVAHLNTPNGIHGFNRYAYANNNPYRYTDPDGQTTAPLRGAFWVGTRIGAAINYGIQAATGASLGVLVYNAVHNESADPVKGILEGATEGEKTKGRTKNFDKPGGMDQANSDFDDAVDPNSVETITDSKGGEGRSGTVNDGSGREINVRPNSTDGRPTVEVRDGKNKTKIRYDEEKS